jgi:sec-independent protein translocase protein TatA
MPSIGAQELAIIAVIVVIIFGAGKLPELGGALGKSIREFKASSADDDVARPAAESGYPAPDAVPMVARREVRADEI